MSTLLDMPDEIMWKIKHGLGIRDLINLRRVTGDRFAASDGDVAIAARCKKDY